MNKIIIQKGLFLDKQVYIQDGELKKIKIINKNQKYFEKDIFIAKKKKQNISMRSVSLALDEDTIGFMHYKEDDNIDYVLCQIKKLYANEKNPKLTKEITLTGKYVVYIANSSGINVSNKLKDTNILEVLKEKIDCDISRSAKIIIRSSVSNNDIDKIVEEIYFLQEKYKELEKKASLISKPQMIYRQYTGEELFLSKINKKIDKLIINDKKLATFISKSDFDIDEIVCDMSVDLFDKYGVNTKISNLLKDRVNIINGINIYIQTTEAMHIIDVNSAGYIKYKDKNMNSYYINELVCQEIVNQIVLRDLSGIILVDFIDMNDEKLSQKLVAYMQDKLSQDDRKATITFMNKSSIMQIIRKKEDLSLEENLISDNIILYNEDYVFEQVYEKILAVVCEDTKEISVEIPLFENVKNDSYVRKIQENLNIKINAKYLNKSMFSTKVYIDN